MSDDNVPYISEFRDVTHHTDGTWSAIRVDDLTDWQKKHGCLDEITASTARELQMAGFVQRVKADLVDHEDPSHWG